MNHDDVSRRAFLQAMGGALGVSLLALNWSEVANAAHEAHMAAQIPGGATPGFLTSAEAADVEAIAAQIIPSDGTPGAREAGVIHFIDRALATFFTRMDDSFRAQLAGFQAACRARYPNAASFAALASDQQIEFLKTVDQTPFFTSMKLLTLFGMFTMPAYGGNRDGAGWKLIGFEDLHAFQPPFGYYDRDYPGFVIEPAKST
jgi:gluconate 2-dehydrogenase gamma chain